MPEEGFRLPASSYEEVTKTIQGYAKLREPAVPDQISHLTGQSPTRISANNAFLVGVGIVEGGRKKLITDRGRALAHALEDEIQADIEVSWRSIINDNEFFQKLLSAIKIRRGMEPSTLQSHVAYSAGQPKTKETMTGAGAIIDILLASGLVIEDNGKIIATVEGAGEGRTSDTRIPDTKKPTDTPQQKPPTAKEAVVNTPSSVGVTLSSGIAITIQIQVQCTAQDIDELGGKLKQLIRELTTSTDTNDENAAVGGETSSTGNPLTDWLESNPREGDRTDDLSKGSSASLFDSKGE